LLLDKKDSREKKDQEKEKSLTLFREQQDWVKGTKSEGSLCHFSSEIRVGGRSGWASKGEISPSPRFLKVNSEEENATEAKIQ